VAAKQIAHTFKCTAEFEKAARPDEVTGLPGLRQLERLVESGDRSSLSTRSTLLVVDVVHLKDINTRYGRKTGDEALRHVVKHARGNLRVADILSAMPTMNSWRC
jgi:diguanylate cyclase (GGDEF)-like protein